MEATNSERAERERAERAAAIIAAYAEQHDKGEPVADTLVDLIADIAHFCDREKLDFEEISERAAWHRGAEVEEAKHDHA